VRPGPGQLGWDLAFLASGVVLAAAGYVIARSGLPAGRSDESVHRGSSAG
jgi:hypothetical protein